jgi:hypothetical protein
MSRDVTLTDPDGGKWSLENLSTQRWLEGHAPGAEAVIAWMHEEAVRLFRERKDEQAKMVRDLAGKASAAMVGDLRIRAQRHAEEHPFRIEDARAAGPNSTATRGPGRKSRRRLG